MAKQCEVERPTWEEHYCGFLEDCLRNGDHKAGSMALEQDRGHLSKEVYEKYREKFDSKLGIPRKL